MARYCCVPRCKGTVGFLKKNRHIGLHRFPNISQTVRINTGIGSYKTVNRRKAWIQILKMNRRVSDHMQVCGLHFAESDYFKGLGQIHKVLKRDVVPSRNLPKLVYENYKEYNTRTLTHQENQLNMRNKHEENTTVSTTFNKKSKRKRKICSFQIHNNIDLQLHNTSTVKEENIDNINIEYEDASNNTASDLTNNNRNENTFGEYFQDVTIKTEPEVIIGTEPDNYENFDYDTRYDFEHITIKNHFLDVSNINEDKSIAPCHFEEVFIDMKRENEDESFNNNYSDKEKDLEIDKESNTVPSTQRTDTTLNRRMKIPIKQTFDCTYCGKSFIHPMYLDKHQCKNCEYRQLENSSYVCSFCNKVLKSLTQLMIHKYSHTRKKTFVCRVCSKEFLIYSNFKKHNCSVNK